MSETQRNIPAEAVTESRKEANRPLSGEELRAKTLAITEGYSKRLDDLPNLRPSDRERLKGEFKAFVLDSATSVLSGPLSEYSAAVADTDGEPGLDAYEFAKYSKGLEEAFRLLIESGGMEKLRATLGKFESEAKESFSVKNFDLFSKHAPNSPDRPANFLTEKYLASVSNISPDETRRLLSAKLGEDPEGFKKGLKIAVGTKAPAEFFEIAGRFAYDAVKAIPQSVEYSTLALRSSFADTPLAKKELSMKMKTVLDDNSVVGLFALGSDSLAAVTNSLFGADAATDGHLNRARELLHRMGNPMTWTPEGSKDVLLALTPVVLKIRQMWNARKEAPVAPKAPETARSAPVAEVSLPKEDVARPAMRLREIGKEEFKEIPEGKLSMVESEIRSVVSGMKYNSLDRTVRLLEAYREAKVVDPSVTLLSTFEKFSPPSDPSVLWKEWGNCVAMSLELKSRLAAAGIASDVVRFKAGGLLNPEADAYAVAGHSALVVPRILFDGKRAYTLSDPGLLITKPITFPEGGSSQKIPLPGGKWAKVEPSPDGSEYPYTLLLGSGEKPPKTLPFDPGKELLNPHDVVTKEVMRGLADFKAVKQGPDGNVLGMVRTDVRNEAVTLQAGKHRFNFSFAEFAARKDSPEFAHAVAETAAILGETPSELVRKMEIVIQYSKEYREQVWNPSARETEKRPKP